MYKNTHIARRMYKNVERHGLIDLHAAIVARIESLAASRTRCAVDLGLGPSVVGSCVREEDTRVGTLESTSSCFILFIYTSYVILLEYAHTPYFIRLVYIHVRCIIIIKYTRARVRTLDPRKRSYNLVFQRHNRQWDIISIILF